MKKDLYKIKFYLLFYVSLQLVCYLFYYDNNSRGIQESHTTFQFLLVVTPLALINLTFVLIHELFLNSFFKIKTGLKITSQYFFVLFFPFLISSIYNIIYKEFYHLRFSILYSFIISFCYYHFLRSYKIKKSKLIVFIVLTFSLYSIVGFLTFLFEAVVVFSKLLIIIPDVMMNWAIE